MPDYFNLCDYLLGDDRLAKIGNNPAIEFRGRSLSYFELKHEVLNWADRLISAGAQPGDRVAVYLYDSPELIASFLAASSLGLIAVPVNTFLPGEAVSFILADSDARILIAETELLEGSGIEAASFSQAGHLIQVDTSSRRALDHTERAIKYEPAELTRDSPAFVLYTSGSTGTPKGVLHCHGAIPATVETYAATVLKLRPCDRTYSASRMFFAYGLGNSLSFPLAAGATTLLHTERPTPEAVASVLDQSAPTIFFGAPSLYRALIELNKRGNAVNTSSLRLCLSAGEALPSSVFEDWK